MLVRSTATPAFAALRHGDTAPWLQRLHITRGVLAIHPSSFMWSDREQRQRREQIPSLTRAASSFLRFLLCLPSDLIRKIRVIPGPLHRLTLQRFPGLPKPPTPPKRLRRLDWRRRQRFNDFNAAKPTFRVRDPKILRSTSVKARKGFRG